MKLESVRYIANDKAECTISRLSIDGVFECFVLEDKVRDVKIAGKTAIPAGTYPVVIDMSNRFKRMMPHILNVPNFEGVRIHAGNAAADTEGCLLVGLQVPPEKDRVLSSKVAYDQLFAKMERVFSNGEAIFIEIIDDREAVTA